MSQNNLQDYLKTLNDLVGQLGNVDDLPMSMAAKMTQDMSASDKAKVNDVIGRIDFNAIKDKNLSEKELKELIKGKM